MFFISLLSINELVMLNINRKLKEKLQEKWNSGKVLIVIGPHQVGKTTLIRMLSEAEENYLFVNGDDSEDEALVTKRSHAEELGDGSGTDSDVEIDRSLAGQRLRRLGLLASSRKEQKELSLIKDGNDESSSDSEDDL